MRLADRRMQHIVISALWLVAGGGLGCQQMPTQRQADQVSVPADQGVVDVGGAVRMPRPIPLTDGLTLGQALMRAGGVVEAETGVLGAVPVTLVALQRGHGLAAVTYHFPVAFVAGGIAGECLLNDGDIIRVIPAKLSGLDGQPGGNGKQFVVEGIGIRSANYGIDNRLSMLGDLLGDIQPPLSIRDGGPSVVVLTRTPLGGVGEEVFIMPLESLGKRPGLLGSTKISEGDHFLFTRPELIPLLSASLIRPFVEQRFVREDARLRSALARRRLQFEEKRSALRSVSMPLPNLRALLP